MKFIILRFSKLFSLCLFVVVFLLRFIELTFSRDESGKITKCLINAMEMEIEGVKIKK